MQGVDATLSLKDVRERLKDLFEPKPVVYWADMVGAATVGWAAFVAALGVPFGSAQHVLLCLLAGGALYRAVMFIHELTHLPKHALVGFNAAWDLLVGIPLQLPSFLYLGVHLDHHRKSLYGTPRDPEYQPFASSPRRRIVAFLLEPLLIPLLLLGRFALVAPLSLLLGPRFRRAIVAGLSSLSINWEYRRPPPSGGLRMRWLLTETATSVVAILAITAAVLGAVPAHAVFQWYLVSAVVAFVNQLRTLGAHRWRNDGGELDTTGQLVDSVNTPGALGALWAPVGLRFHALHHLVPDLPYHALGRAHRRLVASLPPESPYHRTVSDGLLQTVAAVWRESGQALERRVA